MTQLVILTKLTDEYGEICQGDKVEGVADSLPPEAGVAFSIKTDGGGVYSTSEIVSVFEEESGYRLKTYYSSYFVEVVKTPTEEVTQTDSENSQGQ